MKTSMSRQEKIAKIQDALASTDVKTIHPHVRVGRLGAIKVTLTIPDGKKQITKEYSLTQLYRYVKKDVGHHRTTVAYAKSNLDDILQSKASFKVLTSFYAHQVFLGHKKIASKIADKIGEIFQYKHPFNQKLRQEIRAEKAAAKKQKSV